MAGSLPVAAHAAATAAPCPHRRTEQRVGWMRIWVGRAAPHVGATEDVSHALRARERLQSRHDPSTCLLRCQLSLTSSFRRTQHHGCDKTAVASRVWSLGRLCGLCHSRPSGSWPNTETHLDAYSTGAPPPGLAAMCTPRPPGLTWSTQALSAWHSTQGPSHCPGTSLHASASEVSGP